MVCFSADQFAENLLENSGADVKRSVEARGAKWNFDVEMDSGISGPPVSSRPTCNCEGSVENPSIWKESLTWIVPRIRSARGGNLER